MMDRLMKQLKDKATIKDLEVLTLEDLGLAPLSSQLQRAEE